eukprot:3308410-Rhodomonas_salina.1
MISHRVKAYCVQSMGYSVEYPPRNISGVDRGGSTELHWPVSSCSRAGAVTRRQLHQAWVY